MLIFIVFIIITDYFNIIIIHPIMIRRKRAGLFYILKYGCIKPSTVVVILHIVYGVSLQTFFYHYLIVIIVITDVKTSIIHPSNLLIIALTE